jgi:hypothetical protein
MTGFIETSLEEKLCLCLTSRRTTQRRAPRFLSNVRAVERTQLIAPNIASLLPIQMSARRGAACYAQWPITNYEAAIFL